MSEDSMKNILDAFKTASNLVITLEEELLSLSEITEINRNELNSYRARLKTLMENDKIEYEIFTPKTNKSRHQDEIDSITNNVEELAETDRNLSNKMKKLDDQLQDLVFIRDALKKSTLNLEDPVSDQKQKTFEYEIDTSITAKIKDKAVLCLKLSDLDRERCRLELNEIIGLCDSVK